MTGPSALTGTDMGPLRSAVRSLDLVARRTDNCAVALHTAAAVEHLASRVDATALPPWGTASGEPAGVEDRVLLRAALLQLSVLSEAALRDEDIAEALHQATLAHLATR